MVNKKHLSQGHSVAFPVNDTPHLPRHFGRKTAIRAHMLVRWRIVDWDCATAEIMPAVLPRAVLVPMY